MRIVLMTLDWFLSDLNFFFRFIQHRGGIQKEEEEQKQVQDILKIEGQEIQQGQAKIQQTQVGKKYLIRNRNSGTTAV